MVVAEHNDSALTQALLDEVKRLGPVTDEQLAVCDETCLTRYLRARNGDVKKAGKLLYATLKWQKEFNVGTLHVGEFTRDLGTGRMYIAGNDPSGKSILVTRKRSDAFQAGEYDAYLRFLVFTLETAVRAMRGGQQKWVWLMDMRGYSRANSPPLSVSMATLRILADHYPERLHKCYFIDAPSVFGFLFGALSPFIDPVTRAKIVFINTKDHQAELDRIKAAEEGDAAAAAAAAAEAAPGTPGGGSAGGAPGAGKEEVLASLADSSDPDKFCNYLRWYAEPYDEAKYRQLLKAVGWGA